MKIINTTIVIMMLSACSGSEPIQLEEDEKVGSLPNDIISPLENPTTAEKVALGKMLFWDPVLSGNQDIACVSCHHPANGYAENLDVSRGVGAVGLSSLRNGGAVIKRNAPTIVNTAFNGIDEDHNYDPSNTQMFWDNRARNLEQQALEVLKSNVEMRGENFTEEEIIDVISSRLSAIAEYRALFEQAFGNDEINGERIVQAIAAFERSLIAVNSRFDQYARGDASALSQQEIRGLNEFIAAGCTECHNGPMFSDFALHQLPVKQNDTLLDANITDMGVDNKFRTPSLRNVALTSPYMHNGTESTLRQAIVFYDNMDNPSDSAEIADLDFEDVDPEILDAIEAFLMTLTDESFDTTIVERVPSGLTPGGNIH